MNKLLKLSIISLHNALFLYLFFLPAGNYYRIERLTGWTSDFIYGIGNTFCFILFILSSITLYLLVKKFFTTGCLKYVLTISWIPFYAILIVLNRWLIPITERGDRPAPVMGLLLIAGWILYPLYIFVITVITDITIEEV